MDCLRRRPGLRSTPGSASGSEAAAEALADVSAEDDLEVDGLVFLQARLRLVRLQREFRRARTRHLRRCTSRETCDRLNVCNFGGRRPSRRPSGRLRRPRSAIFVVAVADGAEGVVVCRDDVVDNWSGRSWCRRRRRPGCQACGLRRRRWLRCWSQRRRPASGRRFMDKIPERFVDRCLRSPSEFDDFLLGEGS